MICNSCGKDFEVVEVTVDSMYTFKTGKYFIQSQPWRNDGVPHEFDGMCTKCRTEILQFRWENRNNPEINLLK